MPSSGKSFLDRIRPPNPTAEHPARGALAANCGNAVSMAQLVADQVRGGMRLLSHVGVDRLTRMFPTLEPLQKEQDFADARLSSGSRRLW
ncbi:MAG: hypothetical protein AAGD07_19055 [Planctomycetota bacterium]